MFRKTVFILSQNLYQFLFIGAAQNMYCLLCGHTLNIYMQLHPLPLSLLLLIVLFRKLNLGMTTVVHTSAARTV